MSSYSEYLEEHLQGHLTKAIAEAAIRNPKDSVDFIANYLLKIVDDDAATKKRKAIRAAWAAEDEELELKRQQKLMAALNRKEAEEQRKSQEEAFFVQIAKCSNKTEAMQLWTEFVAERTKSVSVYIGSPCKLKQDDEESTALLYDAVSSAEDEYLLRTAFAQSETKGIVFDLLKSEEDGDAEEEDNDEDEDDGASPKKEDPPKPRKRIHLENVLFPNAYRERLHFFKYPKVGSFLSFESAISSYLNPEAIRAPLRPQWPRPVEEVVAEQKAKEDQEQRAKEEAAAAAAADEEEEPKEEDAAENEEDGGDEEEEAEEQKEEEIIPDPPRTISKFVVCLDTMGDDQQYDDDTVQWIDQSIGKLEGALMTIDVMEYLKQREHGTKMTAKLAEYSESLKAEIDAKTQEIEAEHEADPEPKKEFKKKTFVTATTQPIWTLFGDHPMKPEEASFCRIIAAFTKMMVEDKMGLITNELTQCTVISNAAWDQCLNSLKEISTEEVEAFNPSERDSFDVDLYEKLIDGIAAEEIGSEGAAVMMTILFEFVDSACKLFRFEESEKNKPKEEDTEEPATGDGDEDAE